MTDVETIRDVARAARRRLEDPATVSPCGDLDCISVVYAAGVAEALDWVVGDGPLPSGVLQSRALPL